MREAVDIRTEWLNRLRPLGRAWPIRCHRAFSPEAVARLAEGLWLLGMDDRWVIWLDQEVLRIWRSWTGECIYEADVALDGQGVAQCQVLRVCDDPEVYHRSSREAGEIDRFEGVISLVLGGTRGERV